MSSSESLLLFELLCWIVLPSFNFSVISERYMERLLPFSFSTPVILSDIGERVI